VADSLVIIERGDGWLAVEKPSGVLSVPGKSESDCVVSRARAMGEREFVREVHRLDMETSGVMLVALDAETHRALSMQFERGTVVKSYIALVEGEVTGAMGWIDVPIRADIEDRPRQVVDHTLGKPSVTRWERMGSETLGGRVVTRVRLDPETGRTHQLRVHCACAEGLGAPIAGDSLYGDGGSAPRLMLHAWRIAFDDAEGRRVVVESPMPF